MAILLFLALFLSLTNYSSGTYCLCKDGAQDPTTYQRVIDYACGAGADCSAIQPNGPCYVDNNLKAICDYAVDSYFQNEGQAPNSCNFSNVATTSETLPPTVPSGCTFPSSPVTNGTGVPISPPGGISTGSPTPTGSSPGIFSPTGLGPSGVPDFNPNDSSHFTCIWFLLTLAFFSSFWVFWA